MAAKLFQKMSVERGEWVKESDIGKYIKGAGWSSAESVKLTLVVPPYPA
jgi:hypothetical protein